MKKLFLWLLFAVAFVVVAVQIHSQNTVLRRLLTTVYQRTATALAARRGLVFSDKIINIVPSDQLFSTILKDYVPPHKHHLVVVIPSYNNAQWYKRNLDSVFGQDYDNFSVIYTDDASPDGTGDLVREYLDQKNQRTRAKLIVNKTNQGACANLYTMINSLAPEAIVITLDGDDWLATPTVLSLINKLYNQYDVLLTYGTYQRYPYRGKPAEYSKPLSVAVIQHNSFREAPFVTSHLRSFKAGLFQQIKKDDLCYQGAFFKMTCDLAIMFPMLEMAGKRSLFVPDILYIYNYATPLNDAKVDYAMQTMLAEYIRAKEKYMPLSC